MVEFSSLFNREAIEKLFTTPNNIKSIGKSARHRRNITIKSLDTVQHVNVSTLETLQEHMNIDTVLMALNITVPVLFSFLM